MANTQKTREEIKKYFKKYSSPTVEQWHTVLDSVLNLLSDLPLDFDQIKDLTKTIEEIKEELEKTKNGTSENTLKKIQQVKEELEKAIAKKADTAEGGAGYVPQLFELKNDDPYPVGAIAQYIGATDYDRDLIRGFFYEKKEIAEENGSAGELVEGETVTITKIYYNYQFDKKYISAGMLNDGRWLGLIYAPYNDKGETAICINVKALTNKPDESLCFKNWTSGDSYEVYLPLVALSLQHERLDFEVKGNAIFVNGKECTQSGSVHSGTMYDEETKQTFILLTLNRTDGSWSVFIPAASGDVYDSAAFLEDNLQVYPGENHTSTWLNNGEEINFTPYLLGSASAEPGTNKIGWQMIQVSPFMS